VERTHHVPYVLKFMVHPAPPVRSEPYRFVTLRGDRRITGSSCGDLPIGSVAQGASVWAMIRGVTETVQRLGFVHVWLDERWPGQDS
jgi:hypothetical protein